MTEPAALHTPVDALVSFHYFRRDQDMHLVTDSGHLCVIGDSGAFSAHQSGQPINLGEYATWISRWRARLAWVASLDVIGDPAASWHNWITLRDTYQQPTVPTVHLGADTSWLDRYAAEGADFVGLGGLVGNTGRAMPWLVSMFRHARRRHPQLRFHGWGVSGPPAAALPFYSIDSSGLLAAAYRYARLPLFNPATMTHHTIMLDGRDPYQHSDLLRRTYQVTPQLIERSHSGNRRDLIHLCVRSAQLYAGWLHHRHRVSPPASLSGAAVGTRAHLVDASPVHLKVVADLGGGGSGGTRVHIAETSKPSFKHLNNILNQEQSPI